MGTSREPRPPIVEDDTVHDEIRELARQTKGVLQQHFQRHGTSESQIEVGIKRFGISSASRSMMDLEDEAARQAMADDIYVVWRNESAAPPKSRDFCCRVGPSHRCFCNHPRRSHAVARRRGVTVFAACSECVCECFLYVPNHPEEVGDHWLSRRKDWDPSKWSPKCRCGHGSHAHGPRRPNRCSTCGCGQYTPHFACVVCDGAGDSHWTIVESSADRQAQGFPVGEAFCPLSRPQDTSLRQLVFDASPGSQRGRGAAAPRGQLVQQDRKSRPLKQ